MRSWIELGRKNIIEVTTPRFESGGTLSPRRSKQLRRRPSIAGSPKFSKSIFLAIACASSLVGTYNRDVNQGHDRFADMWTYLRPTGDGIFRVRTALNAWQCRLVTGWGSILLPLRCVHIFVVR
jgi:hypothetical protein